MNKRVKTLLDNCKVDYRQEPIVFTEDQLTQFIKAIVDECATLVDTNDESRPYETFGQLVQGKFGYY